MNGIEKISARILADAEAEAAAIRGQAEEKAAVQAGYWFNFRYDPRKAEKGENPFHLDSKAPTASYDEFIHGEVRYTSLERAFPERAKELFAQAEETAKEKYEHLASLSEGK